tara:strand:- start:250 stop:489 length:240 start_codon:yes stop_codon:yes gene_type:complete
MAQKKREQIMVGSMSAQELKKLRQDAGVTQTELAAHLGYFTGGEPNRSVISRWESGKTNINPRISMLLQQYFDSREVEV